jgi:hypothetical protein
MPNRARLLKLVPLTLVALLLASASLATARPIGAVPAQNGRYGGLTAGGAELIGFKLRNRVVSDFFFNMHMECHNTDTNEDYVRDFDARGIGGGRIDSSGHWESRYTSESNGRYGEGLIEINFHRDGRVYAGVGVTVPGRGADLEVCTGLLHLRMQRGPLS